MADPTPSPSHFADMPAHRETYRKFVHVSIAFAFSCFVTLVALAAVAFGKTFNVLNALFVLGLGHLVIAFDLVTMSVRWRATLTVVVILVLITALNVA